MWIDFARFYLTEPTYDESVKMIKDIFNEELKVVKKIGDQINDISVSTLFVIEKDGDKKWKKWYYHLCCLV